MEQNFRKSGRTREYVTLIRDIISRRMKTVSINQETCIICPDGTIGRICTDGETVLWIEYADNLDMAKKNIFPEDGDGFFIDDYTNYQEMAAAMIVEIE